MKLFDKIVAIAAAAVMLAVVVLYFLQGISANGSSDVEILRVYNWEEYISEDDEDESLNLVAQFEKYCSETLGKNVIVEYSTFGTNENMYNELNLSKKSVGSEVSYSYDLVCPSEYMIMKMMRENMLIEYSAETKAKLSNYYSNASGYIQTLFDKLFVEEKRVSDYAACYMWGTMGYVYNPEYVAEKDTEHWSLLWKDDDNKGTGTIKDSMRDSYITAMGYVYENELMELADKYTNGELTAEAYNKQITDIFNSTTDASIKKAGDALLTLKDYIYGYEVDSGKKDMASGKIRINAAWSGDAVYTMDTAEEDGLLLNYSVPTEGSNIWFDGWVMPKGANVDLAAEFINYISSPESAKMNMSYIGYTSAIAGDVMYENAVDWYGYALDWFDETAEGIVTTIDGGVKTHSYFEAADFEAAKENGDVEAYDTTYRWTIEGETDTHYFITENLYALNETSGEFELAEEGEEFEVFPVDLSYFFDNLEEYSPTILSAELGRQFSCQYPDIETVNRCIVMKSFTDEETKTLNDMWESAKIGKISLLAIFLVILGLAIVVAAAIVLVKLYRAGKIFQPKAPDGYVLQKIEL